MPRLRTLRRRPWILAVLICSALVAGSLAFALLGLHTVCQLGTSTETLSAYTPLAIANTPLGGTSSINLSSEGAAYTFSSGGLTLTSRVSMDDPVAEFTGTHSGPAPWGMYGLFSWTLHTVENETAVGLQAAACTQPYVATVSPIPSGGYAAPQVFQLLLPNSSTDLGEPSILPRSPSISFQNGFDPGLATVASTEHGETSYPYFETLDTCPGPAIWTTPFAPGQPYRLPVEVPGTEPGHGSAGFLSWSSGVDSDPAISYTMPDVHGLWSFASVGAPYPVVPSGFPSGLLSFSYDTCPSPVG